MDRIVCEYSEKEKQLFKKLGMDHLLEIPSMFPGLMYTESAMKCFLENRNDKVSDSIRRCVLYLDSGGERMTEEFDNLISVD